MKNNPRMKTIDPGMAKGKAKELLDAVENVAYYRNLANGCCSSRRSLRFLCTGPQFGSCMFFLSWQMRPRSR